MALPLRPLEIKQLFDFSIRIYRQNFTPMVLLTALLQAPLAVAGTLLLYNLLALMQSIQPQPGQTPAQTPSPEEVFSQHSDTWLVIGGVLLIAAILQLIAFPLIHVAVARMAASTVRGEECSLSEALAYARERYWATQVALATFLLPLLVISLLTLLPVAALMGGDQASIMAAVFGSLGFIWLSFCATALMFFRYFPALSGALQASEDPPLHLRGAGARGLWYLKRSWALTGRYYWRILGMLFLLGLAIGFVQRGVSESVRLLVWLIWLPTHMPKSGGEEQIASVIQSTSNPTVTAWALSFTMLFALITPALVLCYQTLLYFDLRFRKEGLDLELVLEKNRPAKLQIPAEPVGNVGI